MPFSGMTFVSSSMKTSHLFLRTDMGVTQHGDTVSFSMPTPNLLVRSGSLLINVPSVHRFHEFCWWFHFSYENIVDKTSQLWYTSWECVWYTVEYIRSSWTAWPWRHFESLHTTCLMTQQLILVHSHIPSWQTAFTEWRNNILSYQCGLKENE